MFFGEEVLQTLEMRSLDGIQWRFSSSKCVDTKGHCVDTTCIVFKLGFWDSDIVSTPQGTVWTPQADCVDTQADCVDTTGYYFRTCFWDSHLVSTPQEYVCFDQKSHDYEFRRIILNMW
ncbi:hypothetical protein Taro_027908 [Colocasia esculenta]|uniref:Uncharacterized protein n=1 Tax=Colocasia esculenta TaxID=4460 RepID=A0A843VQ78_COLES|nr:hypothetical protein [Colocasia esculenta]